MIGDGLALALYGPHRSGADLNADERDLLAHFAHDTAATYARLQLEALRSRTPGPGSSVATTSTCPACGREPAPDPIGGGRGASRAG